jgi:hypothetical protein
MTTNYDAMSMKANRYEETAKAIRNVLGNIRLLSATSPEHMKLYYTNKNLGLEDCFTACATSGDVDMADKFRVIYAFAKKGDRLCSRIKDFIENKGAGREMSLSYLLGDSSIPKKIVTRTMTEQEYNGILNGELPFTRTLGGEEYCLSRIKRPTNSA